MHSKGMQGKGNPGVSGTVSAVNGTTLNVTGKNGTTYPANAGNREGDEERSRMSTSHDNGLTDRRRRHSQHSRNSQWNFGYSYEYI